MGFFSRLFDKNERARRSIEKNLRTALNKRVQPEERWTALYALRDNGSSEAVYGLLKRFTFIAEGKGGLVTDEEEKNWVFQTILSFGEKTLPELERFILGKEGPAVNPVHSISQALQLYRRIVHDDPDAIIALMEKLVQANEPGYERDPIRKEEILAFCKEWSDARLPSLLKGYLEDANETIRFMTVECLLQYDDEATCREPLLKLFKPEHDESLRIRNRIIQGFCEKGWSIKGYRSYVEPHLNMEEFQIFRGDTIVRKKETK